MSNLIKMLINCDLGECLQPNQDSKIMPLIECCNIACGGHAGDEKSMAETVQLAIKNNVHIGAHPSYPDKENFGRVSKKMSYVDLLVSLMTQINNLNRICNEWERQVLSIKPHGALYHDIPKSKKLLEIACLLTRGIGTYGILVLQSGINDRQIKKVSKTYGITVFFEVFADRAYDGAYLRPRNKPGALLTNPDEIVQQYHHFKNKTADTICFHSDNPASVIALQQLYDGAD